MEQGWSNEITIVNPELTQDLYLTLLNIRQTSNNEGCKMDKEQLEKLLDKIYKMSDKMILKIQNTSNLKTKI